MQYDQLKYMTIIAELGSINKAAERLGVAQPNLSQAVINLEHELECTLLIRSNKGVSLTLEGKQFVAMATPVVNQMEHMLAAYSATHKEKTVSLSVSTFPSQIALTCLAKMQEQLSGNQVLVQVFTCSMDEVIEQVKSAQSELGIVFVSDAQRKHIDKYFDQNHLCYHEVDTQPFCVNLGKKNPLYDAQEVQLADLLGFPLARCQEDHFSFLECSTSLADIWIDSFQKIYYFDNDDTLLSFVRQTDAIKLGYPWCREYYEELGIRSKRIANVNYQLTLGWVCRKGDTLSPAAARFIQILSSTIPGNC